MQPIPDTQADLHDTAYVRTTMVPDVAVLCGVLPSETECFDLATLLDREAREGGGTPEWRAWLERCRMRRAVAS